MKTKIAIIALSFLFVAFSASAQVTCNCDVPDRQHLIYLPSYEKDSTVVSEVNPNAVLYVERMKVSEFREDSLISSKTANYAVEGVLYYAKQLIPTNTNSFAIARDGEVSTYVYKSITDSYVRSSMFVVRGTKIISIVVYNVYKNGYSQQTIYTLSKI